MQEQYKNEKINELMSYMHKGSDNAVSREMLSATMQMSDRAVRSLIEQARNEGCFIMNSQNGRGYYLPESIEDIKRQYRQDTNRALSILKRRKHMRKALKEANVKV